MSLARISRIIFLTIGFAAVLAGSLALIASLVFGGVAWVHCDHGWELCGPSGEDRHVAVFFFFVSFLFAGVTLAGAALLYFLHRKAQRQKGNGDQRRAL